MEEPGAGSVSEEGSDRSAASTATPVTSAHPPLPPLPPLPAIPSQQPPQEAQPATFSSPAPAAQSHSQSLQAPALPPRTLARRESTATSRSSTSRRDIDASSRSDRGSFGGLAAGVKGGSVRDKEEVEATMPSVRLYDPDQLWNYVERPLQLYMPLKKLILKSPMTNTPITVEELPLRCVVHRTLSSQDAAMKACASPSEWHKAPFAHIYLVQAETQEHYKAAVRPKLREWVDGLNERMHGGWLIVYVNVAPQSRGQGDAMSDKHTKIYGLLCADFYSRAPGDRTALVTLYLGPEVGPSTTTSAQASAQGSGSGQGSGGLQAGGESSGSSSGALGLGVDGEDDKAMSTSTFGGSSTSSSSGSGALAQSPRNMRHFPRQWEDLVMKISQTVVETFEVKGLLYEEELRRLESKRQTANWNFPVFFVVKEGLALMYRSLQLPSEALLKYQELAALIMTVGDDLLASEGAESAPEPANLIFGLPSDSDDVEQHHTQTQPHPHRKHSSLTLPPTSTPGSSGSGSGSIALGLGAGLEVQIPVVAAEEMTSILDYNKMRFRQRLKSGDVSCSVLEMQLYIFAREVQLFFDLERPAEAAKCARTFIPAYYQEVMAMESEALAPYKVELWAMKACCDVIKACEAYHRDQMTVSPQLGAQPQQGGGGPNPTSGGPQPDGALGLGVEEGRNLAMLLEFAMARLESFARTAPGVVDLEADGEEAEEALAALGPHYRPIWGDYFTSVLWPLQQTGHIAEVHRWRPPLPGAAADGGGAAAAGGGGGGIIPALPEVVSVSSGAGSGGVDKGGDHGLSDDDDGDDGDDHDDGSRGGRSDTASTAGGVGLGQQGGSSLPANPLYALIFLAEQGDKDVEKAYRDAEEEVARKEREGAGQQLQQPQQLQAEEAESLEEAAETAAKNPTVPASTVSLSTSTSTSTALTSSSSSISPPPPLAYPFPPLLDEVYLQLSEALVHYYGVCERRRFAGNLQRDRAELYVHHRKWATAAETLRDVIIDYAAEGWNSLEYWALHRLARCEWEQFVESAHASMQADSHATATALTTTGSGSTRTHSRASSLAPPASQAVSQVAIEHLTVYVLSVLGMVRARGAAKARCLDLEGWGEPEEEAGDAQAPKKEGLGSSVEGQASSSSSTAEGGGAVAAADGAVAAAVAAEGGGGGEEHSRGFAKKTMRTCADHLDYLLGGGGDGGGEGSSSGGGEPKNGSGSSGVDDGDAILRSLLGESLPVIALDTLGVINLYPSRSKGVAGGGGDNGGGGSGGGGDAAGATVVGEAEGADPNPSVKPQVPTGAQRRRLGLSRLPVTVLVGEEVEVVCEVDVFVPRSITLRNVKLELAYKTGAGKQSANAAGGGGVAVARVEVIKQHFQVKGGPAASGGGGSGGSSDNAPSQQAAASSGKEKLLAVCCSYEIKEVTLQEGYNYVTFKLLPLGPGVLEPKTLTAQWGSLRLEQSWKPSKAITAADIDAFFSTPSASAKPATATATQLQLQLQPLQIDPTAARPPLPLPHQEPASPLAWGSSVTSSSCGCTLNVLPLKPTAELKVSVPPFVPYGQGGVVKVVVNCVRDKIRGGKLIVNAASVHLKVTGTTATFTKRQTALPASTVNSTAPSPTSSPIAPPKSAASTSTTASLPTSTFSSTSSSSGEDQQEEVITVTSSSSRAEKEMVLKMPWDALYPGEQVVVEVPMGSVVGLKQDELLGSVSAELRGKHSGLTSSKLFEGRLCITRAAAVVNVCSPFVLESLTQTYCPTPRGFFLQVCLTCHAPIALSICSYEWVLAQGYEVLFDPNGLLQGATVKPNQCLRLSLQIRGGGGGEGGGGGGEQVGVHHPCLGELRLQYQFAQAGSSSGGGSGTVFPYSLKLLSNTEATESKSDRHCLQLAQSTDSLRLTPYVEMEPGRGVDDTDTDGSDGTDGGNECSIVGASDAEREAVTSTNGVLHSVLCVGEVRAFEFFMKVTSAPALCKQMSGSSKLRLKLKYKVETEASDWMICGLSSSAVDVVVDFKQQKGTDDTAIVGDNNGGVIGLAPVNVCTLKLLPARCGLLALPKLVVGVEWLRTEEDGDTSGVLSSLQPSNVLICPSLQRFVRVLPLKDVTAVYFVKKLE